MIYGAPNPAIGVDEFPERSRERFLQKGELSRFFRDVAEEPDTVQRDYVVLAFLTGMASPAAVSGLIRPGYCALAFLLTEV